MADDDDYDARRVAEQAKQIDDVLRDFGVRSANDDQREELAAQLAEDGLAPADARFLGDMTDEGSTGIVQTARRLAAILGDRFRWRATLKNLRHAEEQRRKRLEARKARLVGEDAPESPPYPNMPCDQEAEEAASEGRSLPEMRRWKWCRFCATQIAEGHGAAEIAAEHGGTAADVEEAVKEWANRNREPGKEKVETQV